MSKDIERTSSSESLDAQEISFEKTSLKGYVGFDTITKQIETKSLKKGFDFNILVTGQSGLGKTTFVNTLFNAHLVDSKSSKSSAEPPRKTTEISSRAHMVEENGVKLRLTIVDTPGFGEQLNNDKGWEPIVHYIQKQYQRYEKEESSVTRKKYIPDTRIHATLYFLQPNGYGLHPVDIETMKVLGEVTNLIPVIGKSDSLTMEEREGLKRKVNDEIKSHKIRIYPTDYTDYDPQDLAANKQVSNLIPFAVVGSEKTLTQDGKSFLGRQLGWGVINVEDPSHCEFSQLRTFLIRTHMQDLVETTKFVHYEFFRTNLLQGKKDKTKKKDVKKKD